MSAETMRGAYGVDGRAAALGAAPRALDRAERAHAARGRVVERVEHGRDDRDALHPVRYGAAVAFAPGAPEPEAMR